MNTLRHWISLCEEESNILESPLADFSFHGDPNTPGSFRDEDLRALRNDKWLTKVKNIFLKTPYNFNIYLYNAPEGVVKNIGKRAENVKVIDLANLYEYSGVRNISIVENIIGKKIPDSENSINVLLVENEGSNRISLTPWIVAHRVVHAIFEAEPTEHFFDDDYGNFVRELSEIISNDFENNINISSINISSLALSLIGKFRSAKLQLFNNNIGEFVTDSVTQYIVQGSITYNRPQIGDKNRKIDDPLLPLARKCYKDAIVNGRWHDYAINQFVTMVLKRKFLTNTTTQQTAEYIKREDELTEMYNNWRADGMLRETPQEEADALIENFEQKINDFANQLLDAVVGKAIIL